MYFQKSVDVLRLVISLPVTPCLPVFSYLQALLPCTCGGVICTVIFVSILSTVEVEVMLCCH